MLSIKIGYEDVESEELVFPLDYDGRKKAATIMEESRGESRLLTIRGSKSSVRALPFRIDGLEFNEQSQKELSFLQERIRHLTITEPVSYTHLTLPTIA